MKDHFNISEYLKKHRQNLILRRFLIGAASVVVFVTTYMLILPAITMESQVECGFTEHVHSELDCYSNSGELLCQKVEHTHVDECYPAEDSVSSNDIEVFETFNGVSSNDYIGGNETQSDWEQVISNVVLSGNWAEDLIAVAKSQLGYHESTTNFIIDEKEQMQGYTRYGEWYGEPYRDWSSLFVRFCLHYAQVSEEVIPWEEDYQLWIEALSAEDCNRYQGATEYMPIAGDLIFFDRDGDREADHVGIITDVVESTIDNIVKVRVIEGDFNHSVQCNTYSLQEEEILGYGQITKEPESIASLNVTYEKSYTDGKVVITAYYTEDAQIPKEAELIAYQVTEETAPERYEQRQKEMLEALRESVSSSDAEIGQADGAGRLDAATEEVKPEYLIYNIGFYLEGQEIEPANPVTVTIQFLSDKGFAVGDPITIIHFTEDGTETLTGTDVVQGEDGVLSTTFETASFSDYAIVAADEPALLAADEDVVEVSTEDGYRNGLIFGEYIKGFSDWIGDPSFNGTIKLTADLNFDSNDTYTLTSRRNVTIDLNGWNITVNGTLVNIQQGATLEIIDSANPNPTETVTDVSTSNKENYGNKATYNNNTRTLTYYVTETEVIDNKTGATQEKLYEHQVSGIGTIRGTNAQRAVFYQDGGTLNIKSGMIAGCANRAVDMRGGTLNLEGGYLCGNNAGSASDAALNGYGGAILAQGVEAPVTINLSGTVLAVNTATNGGAIAVVGKGNNTAGLNITGGIISGNTASVDGGGVLAQNATVTMGGGYITNNIAEGEIYRNGGGGVVLKAAVTRDGEGNIANIATTPSTWFRLQSGYITGNKANSGGGGIYASENAHAKFYMEGGYITANHAQATEAGGVRIDPSCEGIFEAGYLTNNRTAAVEHWGGGGIFIAEGATANLTSVLITNNDAGGFGGGVAGCSTGRIYMSAIEFGTEGAAIFDNTAYKVEEGKEPNLSGAGSTKAEDHIYAYNNSVFMESGYQDYFCMLYSRVIDYMLGNGSENWSGSIDGVAVTIPKGETVVGNSAVGLTADPSPADREKAMDAATLYINGNSANTHGGGILCNGYMILGKIGEVAEEEIEGPPIYLGTRIDLSATKEFVGSGGLVSMNGKEFEFAVTDEYGNEVARGYNDAYGNIVFDRRLVFGDAGPHVYYVEEEYSAKEVENIAYDSTRYRVTVDTVAVQNETIEVEQKYEKDDGTYGYQIVICEKYVYHISRIKVDKQVGESQNWTTVQTITREATRTILDEEEGHGTSVALTDGTSFTNYQLNSSGETTDVIVKKEWVSDGQTADSVSVSLYRNGTIYDTKELNARNGWSCTWENLIVKQGNTTNRYEVREEPVKGYFAEYKIVSEVEKEQSYWVPATSLADGNKYMIVSADGNTALMIDEPGGHFGGSYKLNVSSAKGRNSTTVNGTRYTDWYNAEALAQIADNKIFFTAHSYDDDIRLKNDYYENAWLSVYGPDYGKYLRTRPYSGDAYNVNPSTFSMAGNSNSGYYLQGIHEGTRNYYSVIYAANSEDSDTVMFNAATSSSSTNRAKVYTLVRTASVGETTVTITNTDIDQVDFSLEVKKVSADDTTKILPGAVFQIKDSEDKVLNFIKNAVGDYEVYDSTDGGLSSTSELVTNINGLIKVKGMKAGTYRLIETRAPSGYVVAEPVEFTLDENTTDAKCEITVKDELMQYELPNTGSQGTYLYTMAGLLLLSSGAYLWYRREKRRKEGAFSP